MVNHSDDTVVKQIHDTDMDTDTDTDTDTMVRFPRYNTT